MGAGALLSRVQRPWSTRISPEYPSSNLSGTRVGSSATSRRKERARPIHPTPHTNLYTKTLKRNTNNTPLHKNLGATLCKCWILLPTIELRGYAGANVPPEPRNTECGGTNLPLVVAYRNKLTAGEGRDLRQSISERQTERPGRKPVKHLFGQGCLPIACGSIPQPNTLQDRCSVPPEPRKTKSGGTNLPRRVRQVLRLGNP